MLVQPETEDTEVMELLSQCIKNQLRLWINWADYLAIDKIKQLWKTDLGKQNVSANGK